MRETEPVPAGADVRDSDLAFLRAVIDQGSVSRARAATIAGVSKPTASSAAARLEAAGVLRGVGRANSPRGRSPQLYELDAEFGAALVISARTGALALWEVDMGGAARRRELVELGRTAGPEDFALMLERAARAFCAGSGPEMRCAVVSVAAPVDPQTSRVVRLDEAPFPAGDVDFRAILEPLVEGRVVVDNDVNWASAAACDLHPELSRGLTLHLHLGAGLGAAVTVDGRVLRGRRGALGEIGRLRGGGSTVSARLRDLGILGSPGHSLDVGLASGTLTGKGAAADELGRVLAEAIGNAILLIDPDHLVLSGPLAEDERALAALRTYVVDAIDEVELPGSVVLRAEHDPALLGAAVRAGELLFEAAVEAVSVIG